jgi:preprotein translocase subunit SecF
MLAIKYRKIFFSLSIILSILSIVFIIIFGLKPGVDFTGGSIIEVNYLEAKPDKVQIEETFINLGLSNVLVRESGENGYAIRLSNITEEQKNNIETAINFENSYPLEEKIFNTVGPTLGKELTVKAIIAIFLVLIAIIFYIAYVFRSVSRPVSSWKYGFTTIIALFHDILITVGFFALAGFLWGTEIDTLFVTALLVILGYSVNDSIIILDRVRENLNQLDEKQRPNKFVEIVGRSLTETMSRSIITTLTTIISLTTLFLVGPETTRDFSLALIVGILSGAYSSIFLVAPILVNFKERQDKKVK